MIQNMRETLLKDSIINFLFSFSFFLGIWTADGLNRSAIMEIGTKMKERLHLTSKFQITYHMHKDSMIKTSSIVKSAYNL